MTPLISAFPAFYFASEDFPFTINVRFELAHPIDGDVLRESLDQAQCRYPYFSVQVDVHDDQYVLVPNPRPFAILEGTEGTTLGGPATNGHLIALASHDTAIDFLAFHGITDGHGFFPFIKTVLYLYLTKLTGTPLNAGAVRLPGEVPYAPEFVDPYPASVPDTIEPFGLYTPEDPFFLPESDTAVRTPCAYTITLPETSFMKYTRHSDGSPATMISAFLFKTVQLLHPDNTRPITCGMAFDRRALLHVPETCWNTATAIHLGYTPDMVKLPMATLATVSRGMVFLQSQPENALVDIRSALAMRQKLLTLGHEHRKTLLRANFSERVNTDTFNVSYVGRMDFGDLEQFITNVSIFTTIAGTGILAELTTLNGRFILSFLQDFEDPSYAAQLCDLLAAEGIDATLTGPVPVEIPSIALP